VALGDHVLALEPFLGWGRPHHHRIVSRGPDPESRDPGARTSPRPGMTMSSMACYQARLLGGPRAIALWRWCSNWPSRQKNSKNGSSATRRGQAAALREAAKQEVAAPWLAERAVDRSRQTPAQQRMLCITSQQGKSHIYGARKAPMRNPRRGARGLDLETLDPARATRC